MRLLILWTLPQRARANLRLSPPCSDAMPGKVGATFYSFSVSCKRLVNDCYICTPKSYSYTHISTYGNSVQ